MAARVELLRRALAEGLARAAAEGAPGVEGGGGAGPARIEFEDDGGLDAIALDLAIQAAGACAVPRPGHGGAEPTAVLVGHPAGMLSLPRDEPPESEAPGPGTPWAAGPVLVAAAAGWREVSQDELIAEAAELAVRLEAGRNASARPEPPRREILVLPRPLADPAGRRLAAWALAAGAALVLEPDRDRLAETAAWVRPTVFAGDPGEIAALAELAGGRRSRRRGLPFGRLHTVAALGGAPPPAAAEAFWRARGTSVTVV